jgi:hypothetical protein
MPLDDPKAIEIISKASRPNVAKPRTTDKDFQHIFRDFFSQWRGSAGHAGQRVVDLGPGQFDFARLVRDGGGECENIDYDPAVLELGAYFGFTCITMDMKQMDASALRNRYDGIFCKFSISAFWFTTCAQMDHFVRELDSMLKPGGWGWIAPWNGRPKYGIDDELAARMLDAQNEAFAACRWKRYELTPEQAAYYGVTGQVENNPLFLKNLAAPKELG